MGDPVRRGAASVATSVAIVLIAMSSHADPASEDLAGPEPNWGDEPAPPQVPERVPAFSGRAGLGLGMGDLGFGIRLGAAVEYWIARRLGLGLVLGTSWQTDHLSFLSAGYQSAAEFLAPTISGRASIGSWTFVTSAGVGAAFAKRSYMPAWCPFDSHCPQPVSHSYTGYALTGSAGWLHTSQEGFEIGPVLRLDGYGGVGRDEPFDGLATLNLELGLVARRER